MVSNSLNKFSIYNQTDCNLDSELRVMEEYLRKCLDLEKVKNAVFSVIITDNKSIRDMNRDYRGIDKETDVISFALEDEKDENVFLNERLLGDIYISIDKAKEQADEYGHSLTRELSFLAVHGLLHLLGYDHMTEEDEKIMFGKQELILGERK